MAAMKIIGILMLVLSAPALLAALLFVGSTDPPLPFWFGDVASVNAVIWMSVGAFLFTLGTVAMLVKPKPKQAAPQLATQATQGVEIKRTRMDVGLASEAPQQDPDDARLEEVNMQLARLKVQYGMGDLSGESFKQLSQALNKEKAELELKMLKRSQ
jgi:predicted membrane protein